MEWWQVAQNYIDALELWQVITVFVAAIFIALLIGTLIAQLVLRFAYNDRAPFFRLFCLLFSKNTRKYSSKDLARASTAEPTTPLEVHDLTESIIPEFCDEFERNFKILTEFSGDNLLPLQTDVWDANRYFILKLPTTVREELEHVYTNIHSLNSIVWLSTEFGHRSSFSDELYKRLLVNIAEELCRIRRDIERQSDNKVSEQMHDKLMVFSNSTANK